MYSSKSVLISTLALGLLFALGCSTNSPVDPMNSAQGGFQFGDPADPAKIKNGPEASFGYGPWNWGKWDCERNFAVDYVVSFENSKTGASWEIETPGAIRIRDIDCSALESTVRVHFTPDDPDLWSCNMVGDRSEAFTGTVYQGTRLMVHEGGNHEWSMTWEFDLTVTFVPGSTPDEPDKYLISGTLDRIREDSWPNHPDKDPVTKHWHAEISGEEIL